MRQPVTSAIGCGRDTLNYLETSSTKPCQGRTFVSASPIAASATRCKNGRYGQPPADHRHHYVSYCGQKASLFTIRYMTTILQLAQSINQERKRQGISISALASSAGVSRVALHRFVLGGDVRVSTLLSLAEELEMDVVLAPRQISHAIGTPMQTGETTVIQSAVQLRLARLRENLKASER